MDELSAEPLTGARLSLEPLRPGHSDEVHPVLARYTRQSAGRSADGSQWWLNWVVRPTSDGLASAEVAWLIDARRQGQGLAREAAALMLGWDGEARWERTVT